MFNQWQVGNYPQLHQLPKLVEHPLRSSKLKKPRSGANFFLSGVELVGLFGYFLMVWSCFWWSRTLPNILKSRYRGYDVASNKFAHTRKAN